MPRFVELWVYLSATPLFGLTATLVVYIAAHTVHTRLGQPPWANPVLWSVMVLAGVLLITGVPYPTYFAGAQFIHFLLGPAVVALPGRCGCGAKSCAGAGAGCCWQRWRAASRPAARRC